MHLLVLPHTELPADFALPDCPRWSVVDRTQLGGLVGVAREVLRRRDTPSRSLRRGADEAPTDPTDHPQFYDHDLPAQMTLLAAGLADRQRFDAIMVDEAQELADQWWNPLLAALREPVAGGRYVFSDEGQRVFDQHVLGFKAGPTAGLPSSVVLEAGPAGPPVGQKSG